MTTTNPYAPVILPNSSVCCFITVAHSDHNDEDRWVEVGVLSNHLSVEYARFLGFNGRLRRAWRALRGELDVDLEFTDGAELDAFVEALKKAGNEVFRYRLTAGNSTASEHTISATSESA